MDTSALDADLVLLARDKYDGDLSKVTGEDTARLAAGEPLAYVIGWIPFLNLRIYLESHPLIPRPETEWWTEQLIAHLRARFGEAPFSFLDLCAGSGAIGLTILDSFPNAHVSFGEVDPAHIRQIQKNIQLNSLDALRADARASDLFSAFEDATWDIIATNPPYIPSERELPSSVREYEPALALFSGEDGLELIRRIAAEAPSHLKQQGGIWMEADISNIEEAKGCIAQAAVRTDILHDQYDRPRVVIGTFL